MGHFGGAGWAVLGAPTGPHKILGPGSHTGGPKKSCNFKVAKFSLNLLDFIIFYIFEFGAKVPQMGIQAEYRPLELLVILPTATGRRSRPCRNRSH
jgi:hypothetical protein